MRPARLTPLVAVAHGSKDPRAAATVHDLIGAVRERVPGAEVRAAFLDHCAPSLPQVLSAFDSADTAVVLPLLLTAAYHSKSDIPTQVAAVGSGLNVVSAGTLGPHPLLLDALERRLREAGVDTDNTHQTSVVLAAAGSSDPAANATIAAVAAQWQAHRGWQAVAPAYATGSLGPRPDEAVRSLQGSGGRRVVVATYLLAPGYFADKIRTSAAHGGADAVSGVLGAAPEVADVAAERYRDALEAAPCLPKATLAQSPKATLAHSIVAGAQ